MTLVVVLLIVLVQDAAVFQQSLENRAHDAVVNKQYSDARKLYGQLSGLYPTRTDYLIWVGRISGWMQDYGFATQCFDEALRLEPQNTDAMIAKAYVLMYQGRHRAARELLDQAGRLSSPNTDLFLALARNSIYEGNTEDAGKEIKRILAIDPNNAEAREIQAQLKRSSMEFVTTYGQDRFSFAAPAHIITGSLSYVGPATRLSVLYENWNKFGEVAHRGGFGIGRRVSRNLWLRGGLMLAPGSNVVVRKDSTGGVSYRAMSRSVLLADYRHLRFATSRVHVAAPGIEYYFEKPIWIQATLYQTWTKNEEFGDHQVANLSYAARYNQQLATPLVLHLGYARGNEAVSALSVDRIGKFRADTYTVGADVVASSKIAIGGFYAHQRRSNKTRQHSLGISLTFRQ